MVKESRPSVTIRPDDQLSMICKYDTTKKPSTNFGLKTENDMCIGLLFFYPTQVDTSFWLELYTCSYYKVIELTDFGIYNLQ